MALTNLGQVYSFGINNKGQCGREFGYTKESKDHFLNTIKLNIWYWNEIKLENVFLNLTNFVVYLKLNDTKNYICNECSRAVPATQDVNEQRRASDLYGAALVVDGLLPYLRQLPRMYRLCGQL